MSGKTAVESTAAAAARMQPVLTSPNQRFAAKNGGGVRRGTKMGETAGECAAVCCCCPCGMMHLLILAVYRLPVGLWRKKRRNRLLRKKRKHSSSSEVEENHRKTNSFGFYGGDEESTEDDDCSGQNDAVDWDNEMWDRFYGAGFWRSASQRNDDE
ncbi:PREDICTED: uncharacterized protein LOC105955905 [Erythranthe guttata]|uniref:uncharacterized protein LOC105955905 n=1 Tax=Erythranthe guttata TaxID=4155 RepID=UPI00064DC720|nr:PREDICTED: uncharacterized protein LOC105955905 [Erythranthe guttata]|eukprot:XP_012835166.1 PREDICTED: uncharacterized protein LOC105955905 [Erythranthe guttata]